MFQKIKRVLLKNTTLRQTVAKNTFWLSVSNFGGRILRAVIIVYAARVLGAEGWGIFSYALSLVAFFTIFTDLGVSPVLIREMAKTGNADFKKSELLSTSFFIKIGLIVLGLIMVAFVAPHFTKLPGVKALLPIFALLFVFDSIRDFGISINRVSEKMEREAGLFLFTNLAIVISGFVLLHFSETAKSMAYAYILGSGAGMAATILLLREEFRHIFSAFSKKLIAPVFAAAWPFAMANLLGLLLINTDLLMIGWLTSATQVGFYSAADRVIQILYVIPTIIAQSAFPLLSRLAFRDQDKMKLVTEKILVVLFLIVVPLALGGVVLGGPMITTLFGTAYAPASTAFRILTFSLIFSFPAILLSHIIFANNRQKKLIVGSAIAGISNVLLDALLIPKWGIEGSAVATLTASFLISIYYWKTTGLTQSFQLIKKLKKIIAAAAGMALAAWGMTGIGLSFYVTFVLATGLYFLFLYFSREPVLSEIRSIWRIPNENGHTN